MKNISCSSRSFNLKAWSLVILFCRSWWHTPPPPGLFLVVVVVSLLTFLGKHLPDICPAQLLDGCGVRAWALRNPAGYTNTGHFITCFHQLGPLLMKKQNKNKTQNFSKAAICLFLR